MEQNLTSRLITENYFLGSLGIQHPENVVLVSIQVLVCGDEHPIYGHGFLTKLGKQEYERAKIEKNSLSERYFDEREHLRNRLDIESQRLRESDILTAEDVLKVGLGGIENVLELENRHSRETRHISFYDIWSSEMQKTPMLLEDALRDHQKYFDPNNKESIFYSHGTLQQHISYNDKILVQFGNYEIDLFAFTKARNMVRNLIGRDSKPRVIKLVQF